VEIRAWIATKPDNGKLFDGEGLHLQIRNGGTPIWRIKYRYDGVERLHTVGPYKYVPLAKARDALADLKQTLLEGRDPAVEQQIARRQRVAANAETFESVAQRWLALRRPDWSPLHYTKSERALERDVYPILGRLPISEITPPMIAEAISRVHSRGAAETADRILFHVRSVFRFANGEGLIRNNPAEPVSELLPKKRSHGRMNALLDLDELHAVLRAAEKAQLSKSIYLAHLLCAYSAARIANVVAARWSEFELNQTRAIWTIPRSSMKVQSRANHHRIPLAGAIVEELVRWRELNRGSAWCFPSPADAEHHITREGIEKLYRVTLGLAGRHSPHGWRSAFSTMARENGFEREVVELALDHAHDDDVAMAYDRGERFEQRIGLYLWWSRQLDTDPHQ